MDDSFCGFVVGGDPKNYAMNQIVENGKNKSKQFLCLKPPFS